MKLRHRTKFCIALAICLYAAAAYGADVVINEFMAANSAYTNPLGDTSDWIEIYNGLATGTNLFDWSLRDQNNTWFFPSTNIAAGGYLLIFADGDYSEKVVGSYLYADFGLSAGGEYLALVKPDKETIADEFSPEFPAQNRNESYGRWPDGSNDWRIMYNPSPGTTNTEGYLGAVADTKFEPDRGFYTNAFQVSITTETANAEIYYTTDFTEPATNNGILYTNAITITNTTCLRAAAFEDDWRPTDIDTHTYIFLDDVINQPTNPEGFPLDTWGHADVGCEADYEMDPEITTNFSSEIRQGLKSLPTLSLVLPIDDMFNAGGIYPEGSNIPKACSAEYMDPNSGDQFQVNCSVEIAGGYSVVRWYSDKLSMRLRFRPEYGPAKLRFPLYGENNAEEFDTLTIECRRNHTWHGGGGGCGDGKYAQYMRDQFVPDLHNAIGGVSQHGVNAHLYIDGLYWGLICLHEREDESFAASYFGGDQDDYDVIKDESSQVDNGSNGNYLDMISLAESGLIDNVEYEQMWDYLDVEAFIDYILVNFYVGNTDWGDHNWFASRSRVDPAGRWRYQCWDSEFAMTPTWGEDVTTNYWPGAPTGLHQELATNAEYRLLFADHVHRHMFNDGRLTPTNAVTKYLERLDKIDLSIYAESARWGDNRKDPPYTHDGEWLDEKNRLTNTYFPQRTGIVLDQLKPCGLYPSIDAPVFYVNGSPQHGGMFTNGEMLSIGAANDVYYTVDWTDPREFGTGNTNGILFTNNIPLTRTTLVKARAVSNSVWSALNEAVYTLDEPSPLRITEIMYHPQDPKDGTPETNYTTGDFEFIELKNTGSSTIGLAGIEFVDGIRFDFNEGSVATLDTNEYVLLVRNFNAFTNRYTNWADMNIAGTFHGRLFNPVGSLSDAGENLRLIDGLGREIHNFDYEDDWYTHTDGEGYSLTIRDPLPDDPNDWNFKANWRGSAYINGSPGEDDSSDVKYLPGSIVINEALTHQDHPGDDPGDWIELYNTTTNDIEITDWYLSDNDNNLTKFRITNTTWISATGYVVFTEYEHFGTNALATNGFALSEHGERIYLSYGTNGSLAEPAYREYVEFGAAASNVTFGRYDKTDGTADFTAMESATSNALNSDPLIGPIVISEIMYNPTNGYHEYIELVNISDSTVQLYDPHPARLTNTWQVDGIGFTFPTNITMITNEVLLLVKDTITTNEFKTTNSVPDGVQIFNYSGSLDNGGERLKLMKPGIPDETGVPYITVDMVKYNDKEPWPVEPDGLGPALEKLNTKSYGNDAYNWTTDATGGTPGLATVPTAPMIYIRPTVIDVSTPENVMPASRTFIVRNVGVSNLVYTIAITNNVNWLDVAPTNGSCEQLIANTHTNIFLAPAVTNLPVGTTNAVIIISSTNAANSPVYLNLELEVTWRDKDKPEIDHITCTNYMQVKVIYNEPVEEESAELVGNYSISNITDGGGVDLSSADLQTDTTTVILVTAGLVSNKTYKLTVSNVYDLGVIPNMIISPTTTNFQYVFNNAPPIANAGADQTVYIYQQVTLDGSGSKDRDTQILGGSLNYSWTNLSGPAAVTINNSTSSNATFTPMVAGVYDFQLEVSDGVVWDTTNVTVTVLFANMIPYEEPFEIYATNSSIVGTTNGWYANDPDAAIVVTNDYTNSYTGTYPIDDTNHTQVLQMGEAGTVSNVFIDTGTYTNVWLDMIIECRHWALEEPPVIDTNSQCAFYISSNKNLCVWNNVGNSNDWTTLPQTDIGSNEWIRLTVEMDYAGATNGFRVYTNETLVTNAWFDCADTNNNYFSGINFDGQFHLDDLVVVNWNPLSALVKWLKTHYPDTNDYSNAGAAASDTDDDSMSAWQEYIAGTDPTNGASVFAILDLGYAGASNYLTWYGSSNYVSTPFAIHRATNLLDASPWKFFTNFSRDPYGTGTNKWWDESPPSNVSVFYRIVATNL